MASPSSSIPSPPPRSPFFTPIPENEDEEKEEDEEQEDKLPNDSQEAQAAAAAAAAATGVYKHTPTPLHPAASTSDASTTPAASKKKHKHHQAHVVDDDVSVSVSCNKCRPSARDKISIVPLDSSVGGQKQAPPAASSSSSASSPNVLRSLFFSITRRSPAAANASAAGAATAAREVEEWRRAAAELSRKLIHATRRRDEALLESSRLKYSLAELERKVDRLESHCRELKSALDRSTPPAVVPAVAPVRAEPGSSPFPLEKFLSAVDDARSGVRHLARSLTAQLRMASLGPRAPGTDRVAALIHPYDPRAAAQWRKNPGGGLLFYMEALLNRVFYSGFETNADDEEPRLIDPTVRCQVNRSSYQSVQGLGWDEVLSKGTKHYSEGLSRFCDRKMSEVVGLVGLNRAWPEGLLQAFFVATKGAWVVRLLARSVHPALPILRVDQGVKFDSRFMEDVAADRVRRLNPAAVRIMVAPGFHAYTCEGGRGVVKCKVLCVYSGNSVGGGNEIGGYNFGVVKENGRKSFEGLHQR